VDVDDGAVLAEKVDEGGDAGGAWEDGTALVVRSGCTDDGGPVLATAADEVVQKVGEQPGVNGYEMERTTPRWRCD
jgi:hypothetical protein